MRKGITWLQLKESKKHIFNKTKKNNFMNRYSLNEDKIANVKKKVLMILNYLK